jgi:hypothetical protein
MITSDGEPPTQERARELRRFCEKYSIKKTARCTVCKNPNKQFTHMAIFELKRHWDFKTKKWVFHQYTGICTNCVFEAGQKERPKIEHIESIVFNPS